MVGFYKTKVRIVQHENDDKITAINDSYFNDYKITRKGKEINFYLANLTHNGF